MIMQLLILYWSLVAWLTYVHLKFWIKKVSDVVTFGKNCLSARVFLYAMRFDVNHMSDSSISQCYAAFIVFRMPYFVRVLERELFLGEISWLFLVNVVFNMI